MSTKEKKKQNKTKKKPTVLQAIESHPNNLLYHAYRITTLCYKAFAFHDDEREPKRDITL